MQSQNHQAGEQALAPPHRHVDAEQGGEQAVGGAGDGIGIKQVLPHHGQGPLGHDVGKDKDGGQVFPPGQIGSGDQEGKQSAIKDRHQAGANSQQNGVQQRRPQVGLGHAAGEKVGVIDGGIAGGLARQVGVDGTGVDFKGILHNGHNGRHGGKGQHNAQQQQYHIVGLGEKGFYLVPENGSLACTEGCRLAHGFLLFSVGFYKKGLPKHCVIPSQCAHWRGNPPDFQTFSVGNPGFHP